MRMDEIYEVLVSKIQGRTEEPQYGDQGKYSLFPLGA